MCNLSWTPHSNLEKDNSLKTTPVLAQRWAVWSILTKNELQHLICQQTSVELEVKAIDVADTIIGSISYFLTELGQ